MRRLRWPDCRPFEQLRSKLFRPREQYNQARIRRSFANANNIERVFYLLTHLNLNRIQRLWRWFKKSVTHNQYQEHLSDFPRKGKIILKSLGGWSENIIGIGNQLWFSATSSDNISLTGLATGDRTKRTVSAPRILRSASDRYQWTGNRCKALSSYSHLSNPSLQLPVQETAANLSFLNYHAIPKRNTV